MKKILHLFRDPSHDALWSRYLRMLTLIVLFAFGSHGVWGKTQSVSLENMTPSEKGGKCTWTSNSRTLEWSAKTDNLVKIPGLEGDFSSYYNGNIIFSYSGLSDNAKFRVIITKKVGNDETTYEYHFSSTTDGKAKDVVIPIKDFTIQWGSTKITANDLTNVSRIAVAGYDTESGSVSFGTTFTITTSSSAMAMSMKGFQHTSGNKEAQWDATNLKFSWTASSNNFLDLWKYSSDVKDLSAYYGGSFIYQASKISDNDGTKHRLIIRCYAEDGPNKKDFLYASDNATVDYTTIPLSEFKNNGTSISATDLQNVKKIMILGNSSAGALTLGETFTLVAKEDKYKSGIIDAKVGDRNYQIYVPAGITETSGLKLLFTLHGRGNSCKFMENGVPNFQTQADNDKNVVIVSPQGLGNPTVWNAYTDKSNQKQIDSYNTDFEFLKSIILALSKTGTDNPTYNGTGQVTIDRTKVFTVGFSNGGMMSYALVTNHPDVFAAGGSVSGLPVNQYALHKSNGHPVPFIHFQGKKDGYVKYEQSAQHIKNWVAYNGCGSVNTTTGKYDVNDNTSDYHVEYNSGKVPFHFYGVKEAGHIPNMTYGDTSSSQLIWNFIKDRTLGGNAVDMTVVWCPELSVLNSYSLKAWGGIEDNYVATKNENADGNQGVNDRICFEKGKHQLRFTANGTVKIKIYKKGAASAILYKQNKVNGSETGFEFDITEAGDYIVEINRLNDATFSDFGIYKLDLPIESTILDNSNVPTISNGVATYSGVSGGQSTVKYMNVDMTNYNSVDVNCSSVTGDFYLYNNKTQSPKLASDVNTIKNITSGEMTIASLGGTSIGINYFRLGYKTSFDSGKDAEDANVNGVAMYDLTKITSETRKGSNIGVSYKDGVATFTKKGQYDNLVYLDKGRDGAVGSGIRFHYMGSSFRVIVTADGKDYTCTIPENKSEFWATRHLSWKDDFGLNIEQISKITDIRIGGTSEDSNSDEFKIQHIWFDDVDDYNRTFVCYGWENGIAIDNNSKYQYTLGTAKATFSPFGWGNFQSGNMYLKIPASGTLTISNDESHTKYTDIKLFFDKSGDYNLTCGTDNKKANGGVVQFNTNSKDITITNNGTNDVYLSKIEFNTSYEVLDDYTLDGRRYWLYVPSSAAKNKDVPVIFSLHGEQEKGANPTDGSDAPNFQSIANTNGVIVVLPEGRKIYDDNTCYGWQADGKENDDTKFIQALVKEIQSKYASQSSSNGYISVDPKRFYLCGFSEGGMMTYACAKVLNGTFAAYGSCGGFPLNEFHLNLATKQPVPFMHLHGDADGVVGINHLHTIIENLLFRNGCSLKGFAKTDEWKSDTYNGNSYNYKRYDFTGVNGVPVTTVTFKGLWHGVHASAPQYLWDFFSKTSDTYKPTTTTMKWQWDMTTINENLKDNSNKDLKEIHGWKRVAISEKDHGTLTYGDNRKTDCTGFTTNDNGSTTPCGSAATNCNGNHNVYNSIQLEKGIYKLHAKANVVSSDATGIIVGIYKVGATENSGKCIIRRQVKNNSGEASADLSILYPFAITEDGEYYVKVERDNNQTTCTALAIHTNEYAPTEEDDSEAAPELTSGWENDGLIVKIDFEEEGKDCAKIGEEMTATNHTDNFSFVQFKEDAPKYGYKLYNLHRADNIQTWDKSAVIQKDEIFGYYFQNIPKAQFYDRSGNLNYMRAVLKKGALSPIRTSGEATIGFWVNGRVAVDAGLSYNDASMLYLSGPWRYPTDVDGENNRQEYQSMFNIRCNGNSNGFLKCFDQNEKSTQIRYYANNMFGDLCDNTDAGTYYNKNLYLDRNWHYVTMVMYNGLRNVDMYVDGELTNSRQNIVGGDQNLTAGLDTINHIIIGGLNATYTTFGYDPAFAFDDIVIYSRALNSQEINAIISKKKYSPNSWDFEKDIANPALLSEEKLKATGSLWTYNENESEKVYTLNKQLSTEAELTYDGIRVIPAFRGLKFKTGTTGQIQIDMKNKRLKVTSSGTLTEMTISNAPAGQYLRYEYDKTDGNWLADWSNQNFQGDIWISDSKIGITKVSGSGRQTCTCKVHGTISFKSIGSTDKVYADLCFGTISTDSEDKETFTPQGTVEVNSGDFSFEPPTLHLFFNGLGAAKRFNTTNSNKESLKDLNVTFWSSAPHVAYITGVRDNQPTVKATGVPGSAYIYAELENNNKYDCNNENAGLYESSSRIIARYEIHVPNNVTGYSVKISADETHITDDKKFSVGEVLSTKDKDKAVTLTLGGWKYNDNSYFGKTDGYTEKKEWKGMPLKKTENDTNGYKSVYDVSGKYTDDNTYSGLGYYTGGTHAAKSEQLNDTGNKGLFVTEYANNSTAWTLPCRGSYAKVEPTEAGIISVYVLQEGCMERNMTGTEQTYFDSYKVAANEPYDINIKKVYVADEAGKIIDDVITDTKSKIVSQVWKDDGRARAEYSYYVDNTAYSQLLHAQFKKNILDVSGDNYAVTLLDQWNSPGMTQNIIKFGKGFGIVDKGIVRYTFNVLPGKTYYVFSNDAKMGIAGFNFTKDKQLNFEYYNTINDNKINDYSNITSTPTVDIDTQTHVSLNDGDNYTAPTAINAEVTLNRTFYKNRWNAICLPYSINRRQIENVFGDGTMVVLMNNINTSNKKVMFIEHANQDIIAGYPYLIFPTDKTDNDKTKHDPIPGITTRATFGEANSPLFSVGTDGNTYLAESMQSDALVFKGTFTNTTLNEGSYVVTNKGVLSRIPNDEMKIKPYRSYIYFNRQTACAKAILLQDMNVNGFENDEDNTTGIENLLFESGILTHSADVYSIDGQLVRSKVNNLNGLPKGVYIVNGKKYVKK